MGNHRAARRGPRRSPASHDRQYVGRRVAGRTTDSLLTTIDTHEIAPLQVQVDLTHRFNDVAATAEIPLVAVTSSGKRKVISQTGARGPLFRLLPTTPVAAGLATIAVAVGGAMVTTDPGLAVSATTKFQHASALSGEGGIASANKAAETRQTPVSRDSRRDALDSVADSTLVAAAEKQAEQRNAALGQLADQAEQQAEKIAENKWVYPLEPVVLTARFGQYGLWSSYHTGLDFNGNSGDPIKAIANGVVTSTGYDGAYGNKTVVTLDDGTEIWYCHQTSFFVGTGETVRAGDTIGSVGTTGNVTGSHLHLEVRPGGGDPVDPYAAMQNNGLF